jgi:hypothetical protein
VVNTPNNALFFESLAFDVNAERPFGGSLLSALSPIDHNARM